MTNEVFASDHPLTPTQQSTLSALLDTILPASDDGRMPSAQGLDFIGHLNEQAADFIPTLLTIVDHFEDDLSGRELASRIPLIEAFSKAQQELFDGLLFHIYTCYYQNDRALAGAGVGAGPPFPRGNDIEVGDLALLDPVAQSSRTYRKGDSHT